MATSQKCTVRSLRRRRLRRKPGVSKTKNLIDSQNKKRLRRKPGEKKRNRNLFDSQNLLREKNLPREQVVEEQEEVKVSGILTLRQKKRQEEKIRFENKMNII